VTHSWKVHYLVMMTNTHEFLDLEAQFRMVCDCQVVPQKSVSRFLSFCQVEINADGNCHLSHSQQPGISIISLFLSEDCQGRQIKSQTKDFSFGLTPLLIQRNVTLRTGLGECTRGALVV
jgi:hypothetical protein